MSILTSRVGVAPVKLPARSPDLNSFAERWVNSLKEECLSKLILFGEKSLRHALREYVIYHHRERNHQGKENLLLFSASDPLPRSERQVRSRERLGGLLTFLPSGSRMSILTSRPFQGGRSVRPLLITMRQCRII